MSSVAALLVILVTSTLVTAAPSWAAPSEGKRCPKAGQTSGSLVCTKKQGKLLWVKKVSTQQADCEVRVTGSGRAAGTNESMPGGNRVRAATSSDGITWNRLPNAILDQVATPSLVIGPKGLPLLYTTAHHINGRQDGFAVSVGSADGRTWRHCRVNLKGFPAGVMGVDPDVVALPGGGYRMYLTGSAIPGSPRIAIHYADSPDGVTWTYGGIAFGRPDSILDSVTFRVGETWHMYTLSENTDMVHGVSPDGRTFTYLGKAPILIDGKPFVLSQAAVTGDQMRVFGFGPGGSWISAVATSDGATWQPDAQPALVFDPSVESKFIRDPAVVKLANGSYLMVYATPIP